MNEAQARKALIRACSLGFSAGWLAGSGGNLSLKLPDGYLVTPTGKSLAWLAPEDLVKTGSDGAALPGQGRPTSEMPMHLAAYRARPAAAAVVHAHPPAAIGLTLAGRDLAVASLPELLVKLGRVPTVGYTPPASQDLAQATAPLLGEHKALLLAHHGALSVGDSLEEAWSLMDELEHSAKALLAAETLGGARELSGPQQEQMLDLGRKLGLLPKAAGPNPLLQRVWLKNLPLTPEVRREKRGRDSRGQVHLILGDLAMRRLAFLTLAAGAGFRGGHIHAKKTEGLYIVRGMGLVELADPANGERASLELAVGDRLIMPPGLAHRISAISDLELVEFADRPWSAEDDLPFAF